MDGAHAAFWIGGFAQIFFLDLLLSGDNAMLIALACRTLPARDIPAAVLLGTVGAILLRVILTTVAGLLTTLPYLELLSALVLLLIAVNLTAEEGDLQTGPEAQDSEAGGSRGRLLAAITVIMFADAIMSLDNIVALAAISRGNLWFLGTGLGLSIPLLVYGGALLAGLLKSYPALVTLGGAVLGWTAGDIGAADPAIAGWISKQAPALIYVLPITGAIYVLVQGRIAKRERSPASSPAPALQKRRPQPQPAAAAARQKTPIIHTAVPATSAGCEKPRQEPAETGLAVSPPKAAPQTESGGADDRVMLFGLIGLFLIVGLFVAVVLFMAAGSFYAGG